MKIIDAIKHKMTQFKNGLCSILQRITKPIRDVKAYFNSFKNLASGDHPKIAKQDESFVTDSKAALMNEISPAADRTILTIVIFIILGLIWAYFGEITQTVTGTGVVIPSSRVKIIQSLDGGILENIFVKEGEIVQKDQKLLELDDTRYKAEYQQIYEQYLALLATAARLTAETENKNEITFPEELKTRPAIIASENELFHTRREALKNELSVLQKSYDLANQEIAMYTPLVKTGVSSQLELLRAERSANELKTRIFEKQGKFHEDAWAELNIRQGELASAKERLSGLKDKMVRTVLYSPVHGIIKKINVATVGGVIQPAINLMEIVPLEDTMLIQARIDSKDIGFIKIGSIASVKLDAYDYSIYGDLKGKVEYISADIVEDNATGNNNNSPRNRDQLPDYLINIRTNQDYLEYQGKKLPIIPGMTATIQITINTRTLLQYILKPLIKAKTEALHER